MDHPALMLITMKGPPGSGKSALARALSHRLRWPLIDKDDIRDLTDNEPPGLSYNVMLNIARRQLLQGLSVICDSPLGYRRTYDSATRIAAETGATLAIVECHCPDLALWRSRIEARQTLSLPAHHTTTWAAVEAFQQRTIADGGFTITRSHLIVDTTRPLAELCDHVLQWLALLRDE
jgi:predicted kinase